MAGLMLGLLVGAAATYVFLRRPAPAPAPAPSAAPGPKPRSPRHRRHHARAPAAPPAEAAPVALDAADLATESEGDTLEAAATTLDMSSGSEPRNLTQQEIDGAIKRRASAIIRCITEARGAADLQGRVVAGMVVGADGRIEKTRVEAPAYLLRHGLGGCVRAELARLRFPAVGKESVVTVPFDIHD